MPSIIDRQQKSTLESLEVELASYTCEQRGVRFGLLWSYLNLVASGPAPIIWMHTDYVFAEWIT